MSLSNEEEERDRFVASADQSWLEDLVEDPESEPNAPNQKSRQVRSGHYVPVNPTPLRYPKLVTVSEDMAELVGFTKDFYKSDIFLQFFAGNVDIMASKSGKFVPWATPYALSIFGSELYDNCPFKNGNGYGDGRAISIAEVVVPSTGLRWEMQLKGAGKTPFSRTGDGRAVLRSSVREFLASEAMHWLGVSTTRAISLVVSETDVVERPWFSPDHRNQIEITDPRLRNYPPEVRREICREVNSQPNAMIRESAAISTRVAPSFIRVGHLELFSRRVKAAKGTPRFDACLSELKVLVEHTMFREFGGCRPAKFGHQNSVSSPAEFQLRVLQMLRDASNKIAHLTAQWMRVGFCQGNFNSDNCLVGGRTMDYGPFGFVELYERDWNMWSGGGEKYSFRHQHMAGERNFFSLATAMLPLLDADGQQHVQTIIIPHHTQLAELAVLDIYRQKLGLKEMSLDAKALFEELDTLMVKHKADYTIFWRQLSHLPEILLSNKEESVLASSATAAFPYGEQVKQCLEKAFYLELTFDQWSLWYDVLHRWSVLLHDVTSSKSDSSTPSNTLTALDISQSMKQVNPKYVPREWMLVEAYTKANKGNYEPLKELQRLFLYPYDEQTSMDEKYYCKSPYALGDKMGVTCMT